MRGWFIIALLFLATPILAQLENPFQVKSNLYSFIFHAHSNVPGDDGTFTPAQIYTAWRDAGINAGSVTPHDSMITNPAIGGIVEFYGEERTADRALQHILALFITNSPAFLPPQDLINAIRNQNGFASIAHPWMNGGYGWSTNEILAATNFNAVEILTVSDWDDAKHWDRLLMDGRRVWGTSVPDMHATMRTNPYVLVNADSTSEIPTALRDGNFYPSDGTRITIINSGSVITVNSETIGDFVWVRDGAYALTNNDVTTSTLSLFSSNTYARVRFIENGTGRRAYSQPVFRVPPPASAALIGTATLNGATFQ